MQRLRERKPDIVVFPLNEPGHFDTVFLRINSEDQVEVVVLDSIWDGTGPKRWRNLDVGRDYEQAAQYLNGKLDNGLAFDGFNACFIAMLANACWPVPSGAKQRTIVQKLPLVPHQGYTNDCGVFTVIYFAGLFFETDIFLAAFEAGRRLVFPEDIAINTRRHMLEWSSQVVNGYDVTLEDFYQQLRLIREYFQFKFRVDPQGDEWAVQQNARQGSQRVRTASLVRNVRLPDLGFLML